MTISKMAMSATLVLFLLTSACIRDVIHHDCYVADAYLRGQYIGECRDKIAHGRGRAVGKDAYEGDFIQGVLHGHGTYIWYDGDRFIGQFRNGRIHGRGVLIKKNGERQKGRWENNRWIGN